MDSHRRKLIQDLKDRELEHTKRKKNLDEELRKKKEFFEAKMKE